MLLQKRAIIDAQLSFKYVSTNFVGSNKQIRTIIKDNEGFFTSLMIFKGTETVDLMQWFVLQLWNITLSQKPIFTITAD